MRVDAGAAALPPPPSSCSVFARARAGAAERAERADQRTAADRARRAALLRAREREDDVGTIVATPSLPRALSGLAPSRGLR